MLDCESRTAVMLAQAVRTPTLIACCLTLGLTMPASASALVETSHDETAIGTHSSTATCPLGSHIVSGGGWVHLTPATLAQLPLNGSGTSGNGWSVTGFTHAHSFPFTVTAYAYCGVNDLHLATFTGSPGSGNPRATASAACSTGKVVSGG